MKDKDKAKPQEKERLSSKTRLNMALKANRLRQEADAREDKLRANNSDEKKSIKALNAEAGECERQAVAGYRWVEAQTLFSDKAVKKRAKNAREMTQVQRDAKNQGDRDRRAKAKANGKSNGAAEKAGDDLSRAASRDRAEHQPVVGH